MIRNARRRAFTFIEIMFVVVILGLLVAVVAPRMGGGAQTSALRTTSRDIARLAAFARQYAVSTQSEVKMTILPEKGQWYIALPHDEKDLRRTRAARRGEHVALTDEEDIHTLEQKLAFAELLRDGEKSEDEEFEIVFYPQGSSTGGTIVLQTPGGRKMSVHIERATGLASAIEGEPKDFAQLLEEAGLDPTKYEGVEAIENLHEDDRKPGSGFRRTAGSTEDERVASYEDVAARIMAGAAKRYNDQKKAEAGGTSPAPTPKATPAPTPGQPAPRPPRMPKGATP